MYVEDIGSIISIHVKVEGREIGHAWRMGMSFRILGLWDVVLNWNVRQQEDWQIQGADSII